MAQRVFLPMMMVVVVIASTKGITVDKFVTFKVSTVYDHLCGLVVRVPGYRFRGPGSIPGATRFSEK
jgi:hypothetical protein